MLERFPLIQIIPFPDGDWEGVSENLLLSRLLPTVNDNGPEFGCVSWFSLFNQERVFTILKSRTCSFRKGEKVEMINRYIKLWEIIDG